MKILQKSMLLKIGKNTTLIQAKSLLVDASSFEFGDFCKE